MNEIEFYNWLKGYIELENPLEINKNITDKIKEHLRKPDNVAFSFFRQEEKEKIYITVSKTPKWAGNGYYQYSITEEFENKIAEQFGGNLENKNIYFVVEESIEQKEEKASTMLLILNQNGDGMSALAKGGVGMSNVGNSNLIC